MRIIISGILGRMGRAIAKAAHEDEDFEIVAGFDKVENLSGAIPIFNDTEKLPNDADCVIDFSSPSGFLDIVLFCEENRVPIVSGTTGLDDFLKAAMNKASLKIPFLYASNMSIAVAYISKVAQNAAKIFPDADIEIVEYHHRHKADAPSGTAMSIARKIIAVRGLKSDALIFGRKGKTGERPNEQIAIHAVRAGGIVGEHNIIIALPYEEIILVHRARDRKVFAAGALRAAKWLAKKKQGLYSVDSILEADDETKKDL